MKITQRQVGTVDVLAPAGALVDEDAANFCTQLQRRLQSVNSRVVVSLQEVQYLDSIALEGLLNAADELEAQAARLKLANVNQTCREVFELTGISHRFAIFADIQDAVRSFL